MCGCAYTLQNSSRASAMHERSTQEAFKQAHLGFAREHVIFLVFLHEFSVVFAIGMPCLPINSPKSSSHVVSESSLSFGSMMCCLSWWFSKRFSAQRVALLLRSSSDEVTYKDNKTVVYTDSVKSRDSDNIFFLYQSKGRTGNSALHSSR